MPGTHPQVGKRTRIEQTRRHPQQQTLFNAALTQAQQLKNAASWVLRFAVIMLIKLVTIKAVTKPWNVDFVERIKKGVELGANSEKM